LPTSVVSLTTVSFRAYNQIRMLSSINISVKTILSIAITLLKMWASAMSGILVVYKDLGKS